MKKLLLGCLLAAIAAPSLVATVDLRIRPQKKIIALDDLADHVARPEEKKAIEEMRKHGIRALEIDTSRAATSPTPGPKPFDVALFAQHSGQIIADLASKRGAGDFSITHVSMGTSGSNPNLSAVGLTPGHVSLDGAAIPDATDPENNPLRHGVDSLARVNGTLIAARNGEHKLYAIKDRVGQTMITSVPATGNVLKDAANVDVDNDLAGMTALSGNNLLVAVPGNGPTFHQVNADNRGFAQVEFDGAKFALSARPAAFSDAAKDTTDAARHVAFYEAGAAAPMTHMLFDGLTDIHYDEKLNVAYAGLKNVHRNNNAQEGGCFGLVRLIPGTGADAGKWLPKPIINGVDRASLYNAGAPASANVDNRMVGFYFDGANPAGGNFLRNGNADVNVTVHKVRTMHTSSGRPYLIFASTIRVGGAPIGGAVGFGGIVIPGIVGASSEISGIFALPLVVDDGNDPHGALAQMGDHKNPAAFLADLPQANLDDPASQFSIIALYDHRAPNELHAREIKDIFVVGDSVYFAAKRGANIRGLFKSTACVNHDGNIEGWSTMQRVAGSVEGNPAHVHGLTEDVYNATVDAKTGNVYYLSGDGRDTIKATLWGESQNSNLSEIVAKHFPQEEGGVVKAYNFSRNTPGFKQGHFSMMVFVGLEKVMLVQTGKRIPGRGFVPINRFIDEVGHADRNVFVREDQALKDIAPLSCAEVLRDSATDNAGYLYVGGAKGVRRMHVKSTAVPPHADAFHGWPGNTMGAQPGLDALSETAGAFPGDPGSGNEFVFEPLPTPADDADVVALASSDEGSLFGGIGHADEVNLVIMRRKGIRIVQKTGADIAAGAVESDFPGANELGIDMVVVNDPKTANRARVIFATTDGVRFGAKDLTGITDLPNLPAVTMDNLPISLSYISMSDGYNTGDGTLYVMMVNLEDEKVVIKPYDVAATAGGIAPNEIQQINGTKNVKASELRYDLFTDGSLLLTTLARSLENFNALSVGLASQDYQATDVTDLLEVADDARMIGRPVRNTASGALMVPGEFGIRVNE